MSPVTVLFNPQVSSIQLFKQPDVFSLPSKGFVFPQGTGGLDACAGGLCLGWAETQRTMDKIEWMGFELGVVHKLEKYQPVNQ